MKLITKALFFILIAASATFPLRAQDNKTTSETNYKSVNGFIGYLTLDDYPRDYVKRWLDPVEIPTISAMPTMKRGKTMAAFVELLGCKQNAQRVCNTRVSFTIYKPDGSTLATREVLRRGFLWKKQAPPDQRKSPKALARMNFKFGKDAPAGEYKVKAKVIDLNANISFEIELNFYLSEQL